MLEHALGKALLYIMVIGLGTLLFIVISRRQNKKRLPDLQNPLLQLLRHDKRLAQIVSHLSYLHDLSVDSQLENSLARRKMKLILEVRMRIRKHRPDSTSEDVSRVCRQLIMLSRTLRDKRRHKQ